MLAVGGKLSTPKKRGAEAAGAGSSSSGDKLKSLLNISDPIEAQKVSLKTLSKQEKLLLVELQRTRQSIVEELSRLDPLIASNQWDQVQNTIQGYKERIVHDVAMSDADKYKLGLTNNGTAGGPMMSKSLDTGKMVGKGSDLMTKLRTGIDMLPVLTGSGDATLEVGLRRQVQLKLPIFKLPAVDPSKMRSSTVEVSHTTKLQRQRFEDEDALYLQSLIQSSAPVAENKTSDLLEASSTAPAGSYNHSINFKVKLSITDPLRFLQALGSMLPALSSQEVGHITAYVQASRQQLLNAEAECRLLYFAVCPVSEAIMVVKREKRRTTTGRQLLQLINFCMSDKCASPSVFARVKLDQGRARAEALARLDKFASSQTSSVVDATAAEGLRRAHTASSTGGGQDGPARWCVGWISR